MFTDYNVSDHWSADDPDWLKSLVSSLDRKHGVSTVLPLTVITDEILAWLELASGVEAWNRSANRDSLRGDLEESVCALGTSLRAYLAAPLAQLRTSFSRLHSSGRPVLKQPPGTRVDSVWTDVVTAAKKLLEKLGSDGAVCATWDDLVATAQDRELEGRQYRPIAELLFDQLRRRGLDAERVFQNLRSVLALGCEPGDSRSVPTDRPLAERITRAGIYVGAPAEVEPTVVWLGYQGRTHSRLSAGRVTFMDAEWAVPNAHPTGQNFEHKSELWDLVQGGGFQVAKLVGERSDVELLVRVDLGDTTEGGIVDRAVRMVDAILNFSIHNSGGSRVDLVEYAVLRSDRIVLYGSFAPQHAMRLDDDHYGASITAAAIDAHGPGMASALAREDLPPFLAAALEVQTTADHPFSRDMVLRKPTEADISSVVPLADRVVQNVAAHAALAPDELVRLLRERWPHGRWLNDLHRAVRMCLLGGGSQRERRDELAREYFGSGPSRSWILFVADRAGDLLSLCRIEHERAWIKRMFTSVSDYAVYRTLIEGYTSEGLVLEARRGRLRNALVHGNPASFPIVESVREYAAFLSSSALVLGVSSYIEGTAPLAAFEKRTDEFMAMQAGQDAASYWGAWAGAL